MILFDHGVTDIKVTIFAEMNFSYFSELWHIGHLKEKKVTWTFAIK